MKFRFLAFVAMMLGMVSCQSDFDEVFVNGGDEVNFTLSVDAADIGITRAGVDGAADNKMAANSAYGAIDYLQGVERSDALRDDWDDVNLRYTLEVYEANDRDDYSAPVKVKDRMVQIIDEYAPVSFDLRLIANRKYHFVVFADFVPESVTDATQGKSVADQANLGIHHTIGATLADITVKADAINDETTDAYFAAEDITISNSMAQTVILKRPYGKLRVIATDLAELNLNADPAKVVVSYDAAHPTKFNALTGSIDFEQTTTTVDFTSTYNAGIGKQSLDNHFYTEYYDDKALFSITNAEGEQRHTHMTLFTDYILAKDEQSDIQFTMTTYDGKGGLIKEVEFSTQIPIQRNYLTTIIGNVLTTATQLEVKINDNFDNEIVVNHYSNNEIIYTATSKVTPSEPDNFGGAKIVSNEWDATTGEGIITFDRDLTTIGKDAFEYCHNLTSVVIPSGVVSLQHGVFKNCSNLESVTIGSSVASISHNVFGDCPSLAEFKGKHATADGRALIMNGVLYAVAPAGLTNFDIPMGVTKIEGQAFWCCDNFTTITIPNSVKTIGSQAFYGCNSLTDITIPDSVTNIENDAFNGCSSLTSVTIPDSVTSFGYNVFTRCSKLYEFKGTAASADDRCLIFNNVLKAFASAGLTTYDIPMGVTTIGEYAFSSCSKLESVTIPSSVTRIERSAFYQCSKLADLEIPEGVTYIGGHAFMGCDSLTSVTIPNSVVTIDSNPFASCNKLVEFKGKYATADGLCLIVGDVVKSYAAGNANAEYIIPDGVKTIGYEAFSYCDNLTSVTIPASVTRIDNWAFNGSYKLSNVYCKPVTPPSGYTGILWDAFDSNASGRKIYVPVGSDAAYKAAAGWSDYASAIEEYSF